MFGALIGAGASLLGGVLNRNSAKNQQAQAAAQSRAAVLDDRKWLNQNRIRDQMESDRRAGAARDTRGVNFAKLRNEAIAAGFNPLTAMGTAGLYSTELNAPVVGTGGVSGSGGMGGMSAGMGSGGNISAYNPALSSGGFIADAIARGADTFFNTPPANDPLADALRTALSRDTIVTDALSRNPRQSFGYDLTDVPAYRPKVSVGGPALSRGSSEQADEMSGSDDMTATSVRPLKVNGRDFMTSGRHSDAEAAESRYGEIAGEILGISALTDDLGKNARSALMMNRGDFITKYRTPAMMTPINWRQYERPYSPHGLYKRSW